MSAPQPTMRLPSLLDPHVHLRDPGATHKEDWDSGTAAALAGGYTTVLDMPNNSPPVTNAETLAAKRRAARARVWRVYNPSDVRPRPT
ncbi:MAG: amidohydrolase family protein [Chloroflexi bacterium]|nr:amidohydrolase family protein [Chloroflexota bacterium]